MEDLKQAHKKFVAHLESLDRSPSTVIAYKKDIEQLIDHLYKLGVSDAKDVKTEHLADFMKTLTGQAYTNKSVSRKTNSTKTFFRFMVAEGNITQNAAEDLKHPKVQVRAPRILSRLEYGALRDAAKDDPRTFAIIEVLLQTGLRISELAKIELEHLQMDLKEMAGTMHVPGMGKHAPRQVPLNKAVIEAIQNYLNNARPTVEKAKHLFITKTGNPLLVRNIRATLSRFFEAAGVESATVNDLRHTFVAHHLTQGVSLMTISKIAGHKRVSTTERYLEYIERKGNGEKQDLNAL